MKVWLLTILKALDNLANAIFLGNEDVTISSRCYVLSADSTYWLILMLIIDAWFEPIAGKGHCRQAYVNDPDERIRDLGDAGRTFLMVAVLLFLLVTILIPLSVGGYKLLKEF